MDIGSMVRKLVADRELNDPQPEPFDDLVNGLGKRCECGETPGTCCSPIQIPRRIRRVGDD